MTRRISVGAQRTTSPDQRTPSKTPGSAASPAFENAAPAPCPAPSTAPLPPGWRWVRLGDVCELNPRRPLGMTRRPTKGTTFLPMAVVDEGMGTISTPKVRQYSEICNGYTYFEEGDVLFAKITPCMQNGKHAIAIGLIDGIGFGTTEFHVLRPLDYVTSEWIHYFVRQPSFLREAEENFRGAVGQQRVPPEFLRDHLIPLPPLPEQRRIAAILSDQLDAVRRAREAALARLEAARALPASFLRSVFESGEAQGWPRVTLGEVCDFLPARSIRLDGEAEVMTVTSAALSEVGFLSDGVRPGRMASSDTAAATLTPGEVLVARSNTSELVGRVARYMGTPAGIVASDLTIRLWPSDGMDGDFLTAFLSSLYLSGYWGEKAGGTSSSMKKITRAHLSSLLVPKPSKGSQAATLDRLALPIRSAIELKAAVESELAAIDSLAPSLLRRAFSGEL